MKISSKLILIQVIFITGLIVFILAWGIYRSGEDELFLKSARVHNEEVIDMVMSFAREKIYQPLNDNSEWDETVNYLENPTQSFEKECFDPLLQTYEINAIHVFNNIGEKRYVVTDSSESGLVTLLDSLNIGQILSIDHPKCHFFISHQQNLMEVFGATIVPTFDTTHSETPRGYLFFVKNWDTQMLQNMSILTRSKLSIQFNASQTTGSSDQKVNAVVKDLKDWQGKTFAKIKYSIDDPLIMEWNKSSRMSDGFCFQKMDITTPTQIQ
ncbi:MAG: hypothetical protein IPH45_01935 [Bacteroidales bacterium]|nr:hypothetical protein [Bacteroidales bacterium]